MGASPLTMNMTNRPSRSLSSRLPALQSILAILAAALLAGGCSSLPQNGKTQLHDSAQLSVDPENKNLRAFRGAAPLSAFGRSRIEPVSFAADLTGLTPEQREKLAERLASALRERVAEAMPAGDASGRNELVVTSTIVAVETSSTAANVTGFALFGLGLDMGGTIVEFEAHDALTGERIAAARYVEAGRPWQVGANFSAIGHALAGVEKASSRFAALLGARN